MKDDSFVNEKELRAPTSLYYSNEFASYRHPLTLNESRVFTLVCMQIEKNDIEGDYYRIPWSTFKAVSPRMDTYKRVLEFVSGLMDKRVLTADEKRATLFSYISKARFSVGQYVDIAVHSEMIDLILTFKEKNFSTAHFECLFNFKSEHAWRLYFILAQRAYSGSPPLDMTVERLKFHLNIDADSKTYSNFSNIRTKILNVAKKSFEKQSNFNFSFTTLPENAGRGIKATGVRFTVGPIVRRQTTINELITKTLVNARDERAKTKTIEMVKKDSKEWQDGAEGSKNRESIIYTYTDAENVTCECWFAGNEFVFANHIRFPGISTKEAIKRISEGDILEKPKELDD